MTMAVSTPRSAGSTVDMTSALQSHGRGALSGSPVADDLHWAFSEDANGRWRWSVTARSGRVIVRSAILFESRAECVVDATRYGYAEGAWDAARESQPQ